MAQPLLHEEQPHQLEAGDLSDNDDDTADEYSSDPAAVLERREQERGINCFGRPIN